jgi:Fe-S-cluster containining protein
VKEKLMVASEQTEETQCDSCGGCCHDTQMPLTKDEWDFLKEGGSELITVLPVFDDHERALDVLEDIFARDPDLAHKPGAAAMRLAALYADTGQGVAAVKGDCGYLDRTGETPMCTVYEDPRRPRVCRSFIPSSDNCNAFRARDGFPLFVNEVKTDWPPVPGLEAD